jgi:hypothetical protein
VDLVGFRRAPACHAPDIDTHSNAAMDYPPLGRQTWHRDIALEKFHTRHQQRFIERWLGWGIESASWEVGNGGGQQASWF